MTTVENARHLHTSVEQYTPVWLIEAARETLGGCIDLDPASSEAANSRVQAREFYSPLDPVLTNGLTGRWGPTNSPGKTDGAGGQVHVPSRVFCNPPGKVKGRKGGAALWWAKACDELINGNIEACVFLAFSVELLQTAQNVKRTGLKASPHPLDFPICIPKKRVCYDQLREERLRVLEERSATTSNVEKLLEIEWEISQLKKLQPGSFVKGSSPPHSSAIVLVAERPVDRVEALGAYSTRFQDQFSPYGKVVFPAGWFG